MTHPGELVHDPVVFPQEDRVYGGQGGLLASPVVPRHVALAQLGLALLVGLSGRHHDLPTVYGGRGPLHLAPAEVPQAVRLADVLAVDVTGVDKCRVLVELLSWSQSLLTRERSGEGDTVRAA